MQDFVKECSANAREVLQGAAGAYHWMVEIVGGGGGHRWENLTKERQKKIPEGEDKEKSIQGKKNLGGTRALKGADQKS